MFNLNLKENKVFLWPALILFLIVVASVFILKPKVSGIAKSRRELLAGKKTLASLTQKVAALEGLAEVELSEKVNSVLKVLPVEKDIPRNLFVLKRLALDAGLIFEGMTLADVGEISTAAAEPKLKKGEILPSLSFDILVVGERDKVKNFLSSLKTTAPLMEVKELVISQKKENLPKITILINSFYFPLPKTIGKPEKPIVSIIRAEEEVLLKISEFKSFKDEGEFYFATGLKDNPFAF